MSQSADIELDGGSAYLATPIITDGRPGPWPGVVVMHDAFGITDDMREQADWLAAAGYLALVPDLYAGKAAVLCVKGMFAQLGAQKGPAFDQVASVRSWLAASTDCTGTVGVIGYCMGGGFALLLRVVADRWWPNTRTMAAPGGCVAGPATGAAHMTRRSWALISRRAAACTGARFSR